jgi:decaprenylphospho-beta-D-erythro-pentofuranosid-2-ulose 2-reductase
MDKQTGKTVLVLGANSDVAKEAIKLYIKGGYKVIAASRSTGDLETFAATNGIPSASDTSTGNPSTGIAPAAAIDIRFFDATAFDTHEEFYRTLPVKPHIVLYAAGFQVTNDQALVDWEGSYRMIQVLYAGAVSILNRIVMDKDNDHLERIIGLSSLAGVRGRKSNFIYGSTKSAFTQYLAGLRQFLFPRHVVVNAIVAGYIRSKLTAGLDLPESLLLEPSFVADAVVNAGKSFVIVPGWKWKLIYRILKYSPEALVARLP